jgi:hypothetical protein
MTEAEKQAARASFAGKRVSQIPKLERQVFDDDFQYGINTQSSRVQSCVDPEVRNNASTAALVLFRKIGLFQK